MKRRDFVSEFLVGGALLRTGESAIAQRGGAPPQVGRSATTEDVFIELPASGKPHAGKVLAAVQPHTDDIPIFAGGTVAKLVSEGLIHRVFDPAQLDIEIKDRFGNPVKPREWFLVPLFVVNEVVERKKDGTITEFIYDPTAARLVKVAS
jgi:hypothetical protein